METGSATDTMAKIRSLCAAMGLECKVTTARGWSRLFVSESGIAARQIGRAWQREGEGWTLRVIYGDLRREAARAVRATVNARDDVTAASRRERESLGVVGDLEARLARERESLARYEAQHAAARASLDAAEAALTERQRAILAALEAT